MHPVRKKRLLIIIIFAFVLSCVLGLILFALRQNINLFYTVSDVAVHPAPVGQNIHLGGIVMPGSIHHYKHLKMKFLVGDEKNPAIWVHYKGVLPDLFHEKQHVIMTGSFSDPKHFYAKELLTKHDNRYRPSIGQDHGKETRA